MTHKEKARELFLSGYNCAQSVYGAFCDVTGMDFETSLKLSSSFGGGMGRLREVCGACTGAFMVAGILFGYSEAEDDDKKAEHYALVQRIASEFKERNQTIICRELLGEQDASTSPIPTKRDAEFYEKRPCLKFLEDAADIMDIIIEKRKGK